MANLNKQFRDFHEKIKLNKSRENKLREHRDALRRRIENHFRSKRSESVPTFAGQGSFKFRTVNIPLSGDYDIDDGLYLTDMESEFDDWVTAATVHKWILDAVEGHTTIPSKDKNKCIRVTYKSTSDEDAPSHHVDLPIYSTYNDKIYLAVKEDGWWPSNIKGYYEWFVDRKKQQQDDGEQLRRTIRYLKAWSDFRDINIPGVLITIIVAETYNYSEARDDDCFSASAQSILNYLRFSRAVYMPAQYTSENLLENWSEDKIDKLIKEFEWLKENCDSALATEDPFESSKIWRKIFGDRFPKIEDKSENHSRGGAKVAASISIARPTSPWRSCYGEAGVDR